MNKILIVDDNLDLSKVLERYFKRNNIICRIVSEGEQIFSACASFDPDLILLDIKMGDLDGRTICKDLKTNNNTNQIPVIMLSALYDIEEKIKDCKADDYISKPFDLSEILIKVKKYLPVKNEYKSK